MKFEKLRLVKGETHYLNHPKDDNIPYWEYPERKAVTPPSKVILVHDGGRQMDITFMVKRVNDWNKITDKRFKLIEDKLKSVEVFEKRALPDLLKF